MINVTVTREINGYTLSSTSEEDELYVAESIEKMSEILVSLLHNAPQQTRKDNG